MIIMMVIIQPTVRSIKYDQLHIIRLNTIFHLFSTNIIKMQLCLLSVFIYYDSKNTTSCMFVCSVSRRK